VIARRCDSIVNAACSRTPWATARIFIAISIAVTPIAAGAGETESTPVRAPEHFAMSPAAQIAVDALIGVIRNAPKVDERIARLSFAIQRTQAVVAQARSDIAAGRTGRAQESLRQHSNAIRSLEAEFARSSTTDAGNGSIELLRPRLESLLVAIDEVSEAPDPAATSTKMDTLEGRLTGDLRIDEGRDSFPRPTFRQLGHPELLAVPLDSAAPTAARSR
jgi:hypothetical protein